MPGPLRLADFPAFVRSLGFASSRATFSLAVGSRRVCDQSGESDRCWRLGGLRASCRRSWTRPRRSGGESVYRWVAGVVQWVGGLVVRPCLGDCFDQFGDPGRARRSSSSAHEVVHRRHGPHLVRVGRDISFPSLGFVLLPRLVAMSRPEFSSPSSVSFSSSTSVFARRTVLHEGREAPL